MGLAESHNAPAMDQTWLDRCTKCGLCLAVCPTYQDRHLEGYSPRGRINLLKTRPEAGDAKLNEYLDTCLKCRLCETVCPTEVPYGRIIRHHIISEKRITAAQWARLLERRFVLIEKDRAALAVCAAIARSVKAAAVVDKLESACDAAGLARRTPDTGGRARPEGGGRRRVFLVVGPITRLFVPALRGRAVAWLEAGGFEVIEDASDEGAGALLLEHGLWREYCAAVDAFECALASAGPVEAVIVLDPAAWLTIEDNEYWRGRALNYPPILPLWELVAEYLRAEGSADDFVLDVTPATVRIRKTLASWLSRGSAYVNLLPEALWGAGAAPGLEPYGLELIRRLQGRKEEWLCANARARLVTADPLTLIRFPQAVHYLDLV